MKLTKRIKIGLSLVGLSAAVLLNGIMATSSSAASEQEMIDPDAEKVLTEMSEYLGGLSKFSADFDASTDIITSQGQKIKLAQSGNFLVSRPDKFRVTRLGEFAETEFILDGEQLTLHGLKINGYFQTQATTIEEAIAIVRDDIGLEAPVADLLIAKPLDMAMTDITTGSHIGMTTVGGATVHHLAFRGSLVDWQIWIKDGEEPLPVKYVITSKFVAGAPEYALLITNWNTDPQIDEGSFTFTPPADAKLITSVTVNVIGNATNVSE